MTQRVLAPSTLVAALVALALSPVAAAHGDGGALGFRSSITGVIPETTGLTIIVRDSDDRLDLRNETGKTLVILGYEREPYLAFRDGKVFRNTRSPATYLNDDRFGAVAVPEAADPAAQPEWEEVAQKEEYEWHDHRIHWMSRSLPPKVAAARDEPQHVFDWAVPATLDGAPLSIAGRLDYRPPPDESPSYILGALAVIAIGGAAAIWLRRRRERAGR